MVLHTIPINDIELHSPHSTCICKPHVEIVNGTLCITHYSFDGREALESLYCKGKLNKLITYGWAVIELT